MDICVATTTFYKNPEDLRLALTLKTLYRLRALGIPVVIVDGSPQDQIKEKMCKEGAFVIKEEASSMGEGRRQALGEAGRRANDGIIFWMEPEKYPLVPHISDICQPIKNGQFDIVVPRRADELASYPKTQRLLEQSGNAIFEAVTGLALDVWIGPRAIARSALPYFLTYDGKYGDKWQSIFMPLLSAHAKGLKIGEVVVDYVHPPEQTEAENKDLSLSITKRLVQLKELGDALVAQAKDLGLSPAV